MTLASIFQIRSPNLESLPDQLSKFGYHQTPDRLLTDSLLTPNFQQTQLNPATDSKKFVADDTGSQFGELSNQLSKFGELNKSALQIWLLLDSQKSPSRLLKEAHQTPKQSLRMFLDDATSFQFGELSRSALQIWLLIDF